MLEEKQQHRSDLPSITQLVSGWAGLQLRSPDFCQGLSSLVQGIPRGIRDCAEKLRGKGSSQFSSTYCVYWASVGDKDYRKLAGFHKFENCSRTKELKTPCVFLGEPSIGPYPWNPPVGPVLCLVTLLLPWSGQGQVRVEDQLEWGWGLRFTAVLQQLCLWSCLRRLPFAKRYCVDSKEVSVYLPLNSPRRKIPVRRDGVCLRYCWWPGDSCESGKTYQPPGRKWV